MCCTANYWKENIHVNMVSTIFHVSAMQSEFYFLLKLSYN